LTVKLKRTGWLLAASVVLGAVCTAIAWPGIFYSDSYGRWFLARNLAGGNLAVQDDWLSVPPQLFMALLWRITGSYGSFTLMQSVLFFFTAFCAINFFCGRGAPVSMLLFAACPVFYGFAVYVEMSVGCVSALLWLLMLILNAGRPALAGWRRGKKLLYFALCCFLYFCMLGFRQNALTVLPALAAALVWTARRAGIWWPALLHGVAAVLCLALIPALPALLRFGIRNGAGPLATGFLWETVSMLGELGDRPEYGDYLDWLGGPGTTQKAVESNNDQSIYGYHQHIPNTTVGAGDNGRRIIGRYARLAWAEPGTWLRVKLRFAGLALGVARPLDAGEYDYDRDGRMAEFGLRDTAARRAFYGSYVGFQRVMTPLRRPWLVFLLVAALLLLARRALGAQARVRLWVCYAAAACFYASFLINTQSQEFRYFFAPLVLLFICAAGAAGALAARCVSARLEEKD
jgi:hypothetical protein